VSSPRTESVRALGRVGGIGIEMAVFLLIGVKGGQWLDGRFDTAPIFERIGVAWGIFAGFYLLWKYTRPRSSPTSDDPADGDRTETDAASRGAGATPHSARERIASDDTSPTK